MGQISQAKCNSCGHEFELGQGGGFMFELLRCDQCGETKSKERHEVLRASTKCACGGKFTKDAPPRCPECKSTDIEEGGATIFYD
jgi:predicted Zn-ribbon and HTH transcriptional regulator